MHYRFLYIIQVLLAVLIFQSNAIYADDISVTITNTHPGETDGYIILNIEGGTEPYQFLWVGPDGFTSTEKNIYYLAPGEYCVTVTDFYCGVATICAVVTDGDIVTIENNAFQNITVYPNPFTEIVTINFNALEYGNYVYRLFNAFGEIVYETNREVYISREVTVLEIGTELSSGIFLLQIIAPGGNKLQTSLIRM